MLGHKGQVGVGSHAEMFTVQFLAGSAKIHIDLRLNRVGTFLRMFKAIFRPDGIETINAKWPLLSLRAVPVCYNQFVSGGTAANAHFAGMGSR
jgi:hypothetical protein